MAGKKSSAGTGSASGAKKSIKKYKDRLQSKASAVRKPKKKSAAVSSPTKKKGKRTGSFSATGKSARKAAGGLGSVFAKAGASGKKLTAKRRTKQKAPKAPLHVRTAAWARGLKIRKLDWLALLASLAVILVIGCVLYGESAEFYGSHFYKNAAINGIACGEQDKEGTEDLLQDALDQYELTITDQYGNQQTVTGAQFQLSYQDDGSVQDLLNSQNAGIWPLSSHRNGSYDIDVSFTYNEENLPALVASLQCMQDQVAPQDATYTETEDGHWVLQPEVEGNQLNAERTNAAIAQAITNGDTELNLEDAGCYDRPTVYSDNTDLNEQINYHNATVDLASFTLTVELPEENSFTIDSTLLSSWMIRSDDGTYSIDQDAARAYVDQQVDASVGSNNGYYFRTSDGRIVTVNQGDTYGWEINTDQTKADIMTAINSAASQTVSASLQRISNDGTDQGETYIEVSIDAQTVWCYVDGELKVTTPVVTGNLSIDGRATPKDGVWTIKFKSSPYHMKGPQKADGSYEYEVDVNYWLPFNNDVGLHDLSSRTEYGGEIYATAGSHGCINTPLEAMAQIYDLVSAGTPVVVY